LHGFDVLVERVRHGGCEEGEWTCVRKDGSHLTAHVVVTGLRSVEGRLTGFLCVAADVTERNRARERLRMTMEAARIGTWDWDITLDRCSWSDNIHSILGVRRAADEMHFADALEAIFPEDRDRVRAAVESALHDPDCHDLYEAEFRTLGSDGQIRWIEDKGRVFRDAEGVPRHMMGTVMDITERKRADEALRQARDEAESANQAKSSFLASLSHEIRTPLGAIIGLIELLQHGAASAEQRGQLQTMATAADTLLALINDVLDITKIEAGKLELEALDFDIRELINNVVEVLSPAARHKELSVRVAVSEAVPARLVGDPGRLRQVLMNLVNNAIKFTRRGEVSVHVETEDRGSRMEDRKDRSDSSSILVRFTVKDTGIGIDADKLEAIFQPFTQADPSTTRRHGGTGLGLTISSRLVERMGGRIHVESDPGRGSSFWFRLLLPIASKGVAPPVVVPPAPSDGPALRVLLAEDNPVNQQVLTLMLERAGHRVAIANNGREALEALERDDYHLVLMDVQMPEMDGLRCTKLIRQHEKASGRHVPIVAVTANAMQGERQRCLQAGMDDYLAKPVRGHELAGVIARLLGRSTPLGEQAETRLPDERGPAWLVSLRDMGFDEEGITRLTRTFLDTVPGRMEMLRKAVAARDAEQVHKTAHTLKGSLAVFAIQPAQAAAMRLMVLAQQQQRDGFATALAELEAEVGPLLESMRRVMVESPGGVSER